MALQRAVYRPRDAAHTMLHQVIAEHLEAFLRAVAEAGDGAGLPKNGVQFMVKDSRRYASTGGWGFAQFNDGKPADEALHQACFRCHAPVRARDLSSPITHLDSIQGRLAHLTWPRWSKELDDAPRGTRGGPLRAAPE